MPPRRRQWIGWSRLRLIGLGALLCITLLGLTFSYAAFAWAFPVSSPELAVAVTAIWATVLLSEFALYRVGFQRRRFVPPRLPSRLGRPASLAAACMLVVIVLSFALPGTGLPACGCSRSLSSAWSARKFCSVA